MLEKESLSHTGGKRSPARLFPPNKEPDVKKIGMSAVAGVFAVALASGAQAPAPKYLVGGPLAGEELPRFSRGKSDEVELYPGSVEHYRAYMTKYLPVRSFFDRQSQLKNWVVPNIPGAEVRPLESFVEPVYQLGRDSTGAMTQEKLPPVPVLRCKVKSPVFKLDLGELNWGTYAVRVIAAADTKDLRPFRKPAYLALKVNDRPTSLTTGGPAGETSTYRVRIGYVDAFYSVAEIYFHAPEKRRYAAELWLDEGSDVELLVHKITLDDVLAGFERRAIKQARTLHSEEMIAEIRRSASAETKRLYVDTLKPLSKEARWARDEAVWTWLPPVNAQSYFIHSPPPPGAEEGSDTLTGAQIAEQHGVWEEENVMDHNRGWVLTYDARGYGAFLINKKLKLRYTVEDLHAGRALPDPYPFKDYGAGLFFPDPADPKKGRLIAPIARAVHTRVRPAPGMAGGARLWVQFGHEDLARDAALGILSYARLLPTLDTANSLHAVTAQPGLYGRDNRCRQREAMAMWRDHYQNYERALYTYDLIFPYIQGNEDLAASVKRFVPWVNSSRDLIMLLDMYLVQQSARGILRYHDHTLNMAIATCATTLADRRVTDPWMAWLFDRTFVYPLRPAGIQDLLISGCDREGPEYIGSTYYAQGEGGSRTAAGLERYLATGGNPKYDLSDPTRFPKALNHCYWQFATVVGGRDFLRIGDVCGPDKAPGATLRDLDEKARLGWRLARDPAFAWTLVHLCGRRGESDAEWAEITAAAGRRRRAPWLDNRSRDLANWAGILETGLEHDDYRFRRAAYLRLGLGSGHEHADAMDLQVVAHGLPMTVDDGQRSGYSKPNSRFTRIHNTVEVDTGWNMPAELGHWCYAWPNALTDAPGARYLRATALVPNTRLYARQIALVDVDEGSGSQPLEPALMKPGVALPKGVVTPNSYVVDFFRVSGGKMHTYCFHGPVNDAFEWNASGVTPVPHVTPTRDASNDANYLSIFELSEGVKSSGDAPGSFRAAWRYSREGKVGVESVMAQRDFDPDSPRKFTVLRMFDAAGLRALRADVVCSQPAIPYRYTALMLQRKGENLETVFPALIEPYAGESFVREARLLPVAENDADARRAIALEVRLTGGRRDVVFGDGYPDKVRHIPAAGFRAAGEFACLSADDAGLRLATLTGGTLLEGAGLRLATAARERTARVLSVDYPGRSLVIDAPWPALLAGRAFEIGRERTTSYTLARLAPHPLGTSVTLTRSADFYRSGVSRVVPEKREVDGKLTPPIWLGPAKGWTLTNDRADKFWRVARVEGGNDFFLDGEVKAEDFAPENVLRLWEYGPGDALRQSTFVALRRVEDKVYELTADVDVEISLPGLPARKISLAEIEKAGGAVRVGLP